MPASKWVRLANSVPFDRLMLLLLAQAILAACGGGGGGGGGGPETNGVPKPAATPNKSSPSNPEEARKTPAPEDPLVATGPEYLGEPEVAPINDLAMIENQLSLSGVTQLSLITSGAHGGKPEYRKLDGHAAFAVATNGTIRLIDTIDYENLTEDHRQNGVPLMVQAVIQREGDEEPIKTAPMEVRVAVTNLLDEALQIVPFWLSVNENSRDLIGPTQLSVTTKETGDYEVEYRLNGGRPHKFVAVSLDGQITLHTAPDFESEAITFSVQARYKSGGQDDDAGWIASREVGIGVINLLDEALQIVPPQALRVDENSQELIGAPQLSATTKEKGDHEVEFRLNGGRPHKFVTIGLDGSISLHAAPDFESDEVITFAVQARYKRGGQTDDEGWHASQQISIAVTNLLDEALQIEPPEALRVDENSRDLIGTPQLSVATDEIGDFVVEYRLSQKSNNYVAVSKSGIIRIVGTADFESEEVITFAVQARYNRDGQGDNEGWHTSQQISIAVANLLDEALQIVPPEALHVAENSQAISGTTQLSVTTKETGDYEVEYRLDGGRLHEFVTISRSGEISLHAAPDFESETVITFAVQARYKRDGQTDDEGWHTSQDMSIAVTDEVYPAKLVQRGVDHYAVSHQEGESIKLWIYTSDKKAWDVLIVGRNQNLGTGLDERVQTDDAPPHIVTRPASTTYGTVAPSIIEALTDGPAHELSFTLVGVGDPNNHEYRKLGKGVEGSIVLGLIAATPNPEVQKPQLLAKVFYEGENDTPEASNVVIAKQPFPQIAYAIDESWFYIIEYDLVTVYMNGQMVSQRPEQWATLTISDFRGASLFHLRKNGVDLTNAQSHEIRPEDLSQLTFSWSKAALVKLVNGEKLDVGFTYTVTDAHGAKSNPATVTVKTHSGEAGLTTETNTLSMQTAGRSPGDQYNIMESLINTAVFSKPADAPDGLKPTHFKIIDSLGDGSKTSNLSFHVKYGKLLNPFGNAHEHKLLQGDQIRTATWSVEDYKIAREQYQAASHSGQNPPLKFVNDYGKPAEHGMIMFHLSVDGGLSWSRQLVLTPDLAGLKFFSERWGFESSEFHSWKNSFFDVDISGVGDKYGHAKINHIWGFAESEALWHGGKRQLTLGDRKDGNENKKIWWDLQDVGGRSDQKDTVLYNNKDGKKMGDGHIYAILYDYTIDQSDIDNVDLSKVGEDIL